MFVRVFDKTERRYYKSMVYCQIGEGYYQKFVVADPETNRFRLVDYLDKSGRVPTPLVHIIQDDRDEWVRYEKARLLKLGLLKSGAGSLLWGYRDVCENQGFLPELLKKEVVDISEAGICLRELPDRDRWNYILTQADADAFMKLFAGFHDSTLERLTYEEGFGRSAVTAVFDNSGWYGVAELCFEGVLAVDLRPPKENYSQEIMEATLCVGDEEVFWADWDAEVDPACDGNCIRALSLKWRKIG